MEFRLVPTLRRLTDVEILRILSDTATSRGQNTITAEDYNTYGIGHAATFSRRFGSWSRALDLAGLQPSRSKIGITDEELYDNLRTTWIHLGKQPRYDDMKAPVSKYSASTYEKRFGGWSTALQRFVEWVNSDQDVQLPEGLTDAASIDNPSPHRTRRYPTDRQRFQILLRDGFRCTSCGLSPISTPGIELHVDHIFPWSRGGETESDNLTVKCARCNLGKGNMLEQVN